MIKAIFITRESYQLSGARVRCYNFARQLNLLGFQARVFSFADNLTARCGEKESEMSLFDKLRYNVDAFRDLINTDKDSVFIMQRLNYHSLAPLLVSLLRKNKVIFDCDDWNIREDPRYYWIFPSSKMEYATRKVAGHSTACIAASRFIENYLSSFSDKVWYVPTGVDTDFFSPRIKQDNSKIVFSWAGTVFHPQMRDNILFILSCFTEAAKERDNIFLKLAGCGKYYDDIKKQYANSIYADKIEFCQWIHPDDMPGHLSDIDIGLLPLIQDSRFNKSKSPTKLFEYMAMAKPVIASAVGEARDILNDRKAGFTAQDKPEFISYMHVLAENKELRESLGARAREKALQDYSLKALGGQLAGIVNSI
jgi:glycosyltransferase involved in cell wall biosynthesis